MNIDALERKLGSIFIVREFFRLPMILLSLLVSICCILAATGFLKLSTMQSVLNFETGVEVGSNFNSFLTTEEGYFYHGESEISERQLSSAELVLSGVIILVLLIPALRGLLTLNKPMYWLIAYIGSMGVVL